MINDVYKTLQTDDEKLSFLIQNAVILAKDQSGCRRLQKKIDEQLDKENKVFCEQLLEQLMDNLAELMMDSFANYLCQKLFKSANDHHINLVLKSVIH